MSNLEHATRFWKTLTRYAQSSENKIQIILLKSVKIVTVMVKKKTMWCRTLHGLLQVNLVLTIFLSL